jgi:hypothetical protein
LTEKPSERMSFEPNGFIVFLAKNAKNYRKIRPQSSPELLNSALKTHFWHFSNSREKWYRCTVVPGNRQLSKRFSIFCQNQNRKYYTILPIVRLSPFDAVRFRYINIVWKHREPHRKIGEPRLCDGEFTTGSQIF